MISPASQQHLEERVGDKASGNNEAFFFFCQIFFFVTDMDNWVPSDKYQLTGYQS